MLYEGLYENFIWEELKRLPELSSSERELVSFNHKASKSLPYFDNNVEFYISGQDKIQALKKDLLNAKHSINMEYYIFADDEAFGADCFGKGLAVERI